MKICAVVKYPPIQGGVSTQSYWMCRLLAARGHQVHVVTNAAEVEPAYRTVFLDGDETRLEADFPGGGQVRVRSTRPWDSGHGRFSYIPAGNPFSTKLASMAAEVVREHDCDLIVSWYLEPYGLAANLASSWTDRPFAVRHAGSDRNSLMAHPELTTAYKNVLRSAAGVLTAGADFSGFGIPAGRTLEVPGAYRPDDFSPIGPAMDVNAVLRQLADRDCRQLVNTAQFRDDLPTIGIYGKAGPTKGTFDLIAALGELRRRGLAFQFLAMGGGHHWPRLVAAVDQAGINDVTWTLPFLAPWRVPGFIRACTAVCFLERGFSIKRHSPGVASEILACGVPLVVSAEIAAKQPYRERMVDRVNHFLVRDPTDSGELAGVLAQVLDDPAAARDRGLAGADLPNRTDGFGARYEHALSRLIGVPSSGGASPSAPGPATEAQLRTHCPAMIRLLGGELPGLLTDSDDDTLLGVYRLTRRWLESGRLDGDGPVAQMARAEHHFLWFDVDVEGVDGVPVFGVSSFTLPDLAELTDAEFRTLRPVSSRLLRVERFSIDVAGYAHARSEEPAIGDSRVLLFHKRPQLGGSILEIGDSVAEVLRSCDGTNTVASIERDRPSLSIRPLLETLHGSAAIAFAGFRPEERITAW